MVSYLKRYLTVDRKKGLPDEIQLRFLKRLLRLLENGYPMIAALEIIKWDKQLLRIANRIITSLKSGIPIDQAFEQAKFHHTITAYLYFVKENGDVIASVEKCIKMYADRLKYTKKFQEISRYPLILLFIFSLLLYFIKQFVLPSFTEIFQYSSEASSTINISIMIIEYLVTLVIILGILFMVCFLFWYLNKRKFSIKTQIKIYSSIPIYRRFLTLQTSFQFATHLSTLLKTGMSLKEILQSISEQKKLPIIAYYTTLMTSELSNGFHIADLLSQLNLLEAQLAAIFQKNTDQHALEKDLVIYAELLTDELHRKMLKAITLIQPIFFIIIACFVIFIYITLMWPMFQLIKTI